MSMLHAGYEGDLRLAKVLDAEIRLSLADRGSMRRTGAVDFGGSVNGTYSDTHTVRQIDLDGASAFGAMAAEDTAVTATDPTVTTADVAVGRASFMRSIGDQFVFTGPQGRRIDAPRLAQSMAGEWDAYWMDTLATLIATASTDVGTTTVDMSVDDQMDAIYQMILSSVPGPFFELLHGRQFADFLGSLRGETGPLALIPATPALLSLTGPGHKGSFLNCNIWVSDAVTASGGDRNGALWGAGAMVYKVGVAEAPIGTVSVRPDQEILVEFSRTGTQALTHVIGHGYLGMSIREQARIVGIVTDQ